MFIIWGTKVINKKLDFVQEVLCNHCGRRGIIEVYKQSTAFTLFYIPTFRWGTKYLARMSCCGFVIELDKDLGKQIEKGEIQQLSKFLFPEGQHVHVCANCGNEYKGDGKFCPECGNEFSE